MPPVPQQLRSKVPIAAGTCAGRELVPVGVCARAWLAKLASAVAMGRRGTMLACLLARVTCAVTLAKVDSLRVASGDNVSL